MLEAYKAATVALVRSDMPDLTQRQMAIVLVVYTEDEEQTVRGLAARLNIGRPPVVRALDRLTELGLAYRKLDPRDRRSVLVQRTAEGQALVDAVRRWLAPAVAEAAE